MQQHNFKAYCFYCIGFQISYLVLASNWMMAIDLLNFEWWHFFTLSPTSSNPHSLSTLSASSLLIWVLHQHKAYLKMSHYLSCSNNKFHHLVHITREIIWKQVLLPSPSIRDLWLHGLSTTSWSLSNHYCKSEPKLSKYVHRNFALSTIIKPWENWHI